MRARTDVTILQAWQHYPQTEPVSYSSGLAATDCLPEVHAAITRLNPMSVAGRAHHNKINVFQTIEI